MLLNMIIVLAMVLLWITCSHAQSCGEACFDCRSDGNCRECYYGYYEYIQDGRGICLKCPQGCLLCQHYSNSNSTLCYDCWSGFYLSDEYTCIACTGGRCDECQDKPGYWAYDCRYSCTQCSECVSEGCTRLCYDSEGDNCLHNNTQQCADSKCSLWFGGPRKSDKGPLMTQTTTKETILSTHKTTTRVPQIMTSIDTRQPSTRTTPTKTTRSTRIMTTRAPSTITTRPTRQKTTRSTPVDYSVVYILVSVVCLSVLGNIVFLACYSIRRRQRNNRRRQSGPSSHNTTNEESTQLAENIVGSYSANATGNVPTTGNPTDNVPTVTINSVTVNVPSTSNVTGNINVHTNTTASGYVNLMVDHIAVSVEPGHGYEPLTQYGNVREIENAYSALGDDENVTIYYTVAD